MLLYATTRYTPLTLCREGGGQTLAAQSGIIMLRVHYTTTVLQYSIVQEIDLKEKKIVPRAILTD